MPPKSAAIEDDVQIVLGNLNVSPADQKATWTNDKPQVTSYSRLTIESKPVIYEVRCTFHFSGFQTMPSPQPPKPVSGKEDLVLRASDLGTTHLQGKESDVLRDGDNTDSTSGKSQYGNAITISASRRLRSE